MSDVLLKMSELTRLIAQGRERPQDPIDDIIRSASGPRGTQDFLTEQLEHLVRRPELYAPAPEVSLEATLAHAAALMGVLARVLGTLSFERFNDHFGRERLSHLWRLVRSPARTNDEREGAIQAYVKAFLGWTSSHQIVWSQTITIPGVRGKFPSVDVFRETHELSSASDALKVAMTQKGVDSRHVFALGPFFTSQGETITLSVHLLNAPMSLANEFESAVMSTVRRIGLVE